MKVIHLPPRDSSFRAWWQRPDIWYLGVPTAQEEKERPTELAALRSILIQAQNAIEPPALTEKQKEIIHHLKDAKAQNIRAVVGYTANRLNMSHQAICKEIVKIGHKEDLARLQNAHLRPYEIGELYDTPRETKIRRVRSTLKRECAGCDKHTQNPQLPLCKACHDVWGERDNWPEWLLFRANDIERELRQDAVAIMEHRQLEQAA